MTEELDQLLQNLHLKKIREIGEDQIRRAEKEQIFFR